MRIRVPRRLAGACVFGLLASIAYSSGASASGLSDKQTAHIERNVHCSILMLTDLSAFRADPDCGGTAVETHSIGPSGSGNGLRTIPPVPCDNCPQPALLAIVDECQIE